MSRYGLHRSEVVDRLIRAYNVSPIRVEQMATAWEFEANRNGIDPRSPGFWRAGRRWMETELGREEPRASGAPGG
jgi:hypothetical protein